MNDIRNIGYLQQLQEFERNDKLDICDT